MNAAEAKPEWAEVRRILQARASISLQGIIGFMAGGVLVGASYAFSGAAGMVNLVAGFLLAGFGVLQLRRLGAT